MNGRNLTPIEILLVEDNPGDADLARDALDESKLMNNLHVLTDGEAATDFLFRRNDYTDVPRPDLIILDLNLPRKSGLEVLQEVKTAPALRGIPVVILTTSEEERDVLQSYEDHANCYITKPIDLDKFHKVVDSIEDFWFSIVRLPK